MNLDQCFGFIVSLCINATLSLDFDTTIAYFLLSIFFIDFHLEKKLQKFCYNSKIQVDCNKRNAHIILTVTSKKFIFDC